MSTLPFLLTLIVALAASVACIVLYRRFAKVEQRCAQLANAMTVQKMYLQNMSHEVRTPMNAICGFSQIMCDAQMNALLSDRERAEYGAIIQSNTELLTSLVDDILDMGNMQNGSYSVQLADCCINDVCRQAVSSVVYRCPEGVKMYMTSDVDDSYTLTTDAKRVGKVLLNYLTNAVKHTTEGEICLHVSPTETQGMLTLSVTDTGEGVPLDKAEYIFLRFERLDDNSTDASGIGLAICRNIATLLGGEARLDTRHAGGGARFVLTLPLNPNCSLGHPSAY